MLAYGKPAAKIPETLNFRSERSCGSHGIENTFEYSPNLKKKKLNFSPLLLFHSLFKTTLLLSNERVSGRLLAHV